MVFKNKIHINMYLKWSKDVQVYWNRGRKFVGAGIGVGVSVGVGVDVL